MVATLWALAGAWVIFDAAFPPARVQSMLWMFAATVLFIAAASSAFISWYIIRANTTPPSEIRHATEIGFESGRRYERDLQDNVIESRDDTNVIQLDEHIEMHRPVPPQPPPDWHRLAEHGDTTSSSG